jgi:diguanylate cyclase (GGDEF)-like protein
MVNILLKINTNGIITDVLWCDPAYLLFVTDSPIREYFHTDNHDDLDCALKNAFAEQTFTSPFYAQIKNGPKVCIVLAQIDDDILMFAYQSDSSESIEADDFLGIIRRFFDVLKINEANVEYYGVEAQTMNFEKIQMLNNDLINMQRKLEKVNAQLNVANQLLNNRLVRDELTGLVSRYQYRQEIDLLIRKLPAAFGIFAFLDIDYFKQVNDTYGHVVGDRYLIEFAQRLKNIPLDNMICIRISGDEFGLFWQGIEDQKIDSAIIELWRHITSHVVNEPIEIDDKSIPISVSVGMSVFNLDTTNVYDLIDYADYAMYMAKKAGKNRFERFNKSTYRQEKVQE